MSVQAKIAGTAGEPGPIGPQQTYFRYLQEGQWRIPRCCGCGQAVFYPRIACPTCAGQGFEWVAPCGLGTIYATTGMRRPAQAGGDLNLCLVDLDEGVRMMSRIEGVDPAMPRIGHRVHGEVRRAGEQSLVVFELLEGAQ